MSFDIETTSFHSKIITFPIGKEDDKIPSAPLEESAAPGEIELQMRSKLATLTNCSYPDTFDWSVYDKIAAKFEAPPRGGVVFGTTFKLANWHSTCSKCHYAFEVDTYGRGCFHNCGYCYAKDRLTSRGYWNNPQPFPLDLAEIRKVFYTVFETDKSSKWRDILTSKVPLRIGSMSDSFMWLDVKYGVTKEFMRILRYYRYPNIVFTRSDLIAHDDYIAVLDPKLTAVQFSISGNNPELIRKLEPGAPSVKRRLQAISKLSQAGFWTGVRINPLFPKYPDGFFSGSESFKKKFGPGTKIPELNLIDDDFVPQIAESGAKTFLAGFVRLSGHAVDAVSKASGTDFRSFFEAYRPGNSDNVYSSREIAHYYGQFHKHAKQSNLRFSTCYIGTGLDEYFRHQQMWSNKEDCCDIRGSVKSFNASSQQIGWDVRIAHSQFKELAQKAQLAEAEYPERTELTFTKTVNPEILGRSRILASVQNNGENPLL